MQGAIGDIYYSVPTSIVFSPWSSVKIRHPEELDMLTIIVNYLRAHVNVRADTSWITPASKLLLRSGAHIQNPGQEVLKMFVPIAVAVMVAYFSFRHLQEYRNLPSPATFYGSLPRVRGVYARYPGDCRGHDR